MDVYGSNRIGNDPPPDPCCTWQRKLRGEFQTQFVGAKNKWFSFESDPQNYHAVERIKSGSRRSSALFSPKNWKRLPSHCLDELIDIGFYPLHSAQSVPLSPLPCLAVLSQASGLLPDNADTESRTNLAQVMTLSAPTDEEQLEIEEWCKDETLSLPFSDLLCSGGSILPPHLLNLMNSLNMFNLGMPPVTKSNLCRSGLEAELI